MSGGATSFGAGADRAEFPVGHVLFRVTAHPAHGVTFGLRAEGQPDGRDLFSGPVTPGMAGELRALADHLDGVGVDNG